MTHDVAVHVKGYLTVFGALLVLTLVTVALSYLEMSIAPTVAIGLSIATVKAALVAMFFMHLRHERAPIYWTLALTAVLFVVLIGFTLWTEADHARGTRFAPPFEDGVR
jgi:cytochrome c oxidase subunit IV